jgi:hypothetical protein
MLPSDASSVFVIVFLFHRKTQDAPSRVRDHPSHHEAGQQDEED